MNFPEEPIHLKESGATILSRAEYDRLLNIEGEYQRLRAEVEHTADRLEEHDGGPESTEFRRMICYAKKLRAAIAKAKEIKR